MFLCIHPTTHDTSTSSHLDDILTEDAILKWYQDAHITKGKREFIGQMKYMIDWFNTAEEESDEAEDTAEQLSWATFQFHSCFTVHIKFYK